MKNTKAIALGICAVFLVAMAGAGIAIARESNVQDEVCLSCQPSNVQGADVGGKTYTFTIAGPGASWSTSSTLSADAPKDYDTYKMTVSKNCTVTVEVIDCCIMGDTMGLKAGPKVLKATSPATIKVSAPLKPGTYTFYAGYIKCPGGYPAGYSTYVTAK